MRVIDPLLPVIAREFGVTLGAIGLVVTAYALPYGICILGYGPLGDRYGKLRVIAVTLSLAAACIVASGFANSVTTLALGRFLTGMTCAATVPLTLAYIADHVEFEQRQGVIARYMSGVILGQICGSGLGGVLADVIGWHAIFWVFGATTGVVAAAVWWGTTQPPLAPQVRIGLRTALTRYRALFDDAKARELFTAIFVEGFCMLGGVAFIGALLHQRHGLSMTWVGLFLMGLGLGGLLYSALVHWLLRMIGQRVMMIIGGVLMAQSFVVLAIAPVAWVCAPALVVLGFGFYLMHNTFQTLATELAPEARGTAVSLFVFMLFSGQGIGAAAWGYVIDVHGFTIAFGMVGILLGLLAMWMQGGRSLARYRYVD